VKKFRLASFVFCYHFFNNYAEHNLQPKHFTTKETAIKLQLYHSSVFCFVNIISLFALFSKQKH
jgi:hypothetical protein